MINKDGSNFRVKINKTNNKDLSGLIIGLQKSTITEPSMKTIKTDSIALNGKGYCYTYNIEEKTQEYTLHEGSILEVDVNKSKVTFSVDGTVVGRSTLSGEDYRFAV